MSMPCTKCAVKTCLTKWKCSTTNPKPLVFDESNCSEIMCLRIKFMPFTVLEFFHIHSTADFWSNFVIRKHRTENDFIVNTLSKNCLPVSFGIYHYAVIYDAIAWSPISWRLHWYICLFFSDQYVKWYGWIFIFFPNASRICLTKDELLLHYIVTSTLTKTDVKIDKASVTIMADFCPEFNPPFRWRCKHQTKIAVHINNLVSSEFPNRSNRSARSFTSTFNCA